MRHTGSSLREATAKRLRKQLGRSRLSTILRVFSESKLLGSSFNSLRGEVVGSIDRLCRKGMNIFIPYLLVAMTRYSMIDVQLLG